MALIEGTTVPAQLRGLGSLPVARQLVLLVGIALAIAAGVAVVLWSQEPNYRVVHPNLSGKYQAQLMDVLQSAGIDYRLDSRSGAVMVPATDLQRARIQMSASGVPLSGEKGYELLDDTQGFGTSQRMEAARFQRALEGELTRSIRALHGVDQARVHLALPERSVFVRDRMQPSASVVLQLYPGRRLDDGRIAGIQELVASSVPELLPENVAVLDDQGRLLSQTENSPAMAMTGRYLAMTWEVEKTYVERIERLLEPMFGPDGVRAQVSAEIDYSEIETTSENYDPDNRATPLLRSEQIIESSDNNRSGAAGVPGALTNQPPQETVLEQLDSAPGNPAGITPEVSGNDRMSREMTRNYELDRRIQRVKSAPGQIQRLSVAVLVDQPVADDADESTEQQSEQRLGNIEALVSGAIGLNAERGDVIRVDAVDFKRRVIDMEPLPATSLWEQAWLWDVLKQIVGVVLVIMLLLAILRPALKTLAYPPGLTHSHQASLPATSTGAPGLPAPVSSDAGNGETESTNMLEQRLSQARTIANQDPKRVAQLTRSWVSGDE